MDERLSTGADSPDAPTTDQLLHPTETVPIEWLKPHPRNYRSHPDDQIDHIVELIRLHGIYKNIVVARDYTILTGHGVTKGAKKFGLKVVPVVRLDLDPMSPQAIKILTGDNEISKLGEVDDRLLSILLKEVHDADPDGLMGTGYDDMMLANLVMVTRPASEIPDVNKAAEWVGMPEFNPAPDPIKLIVSFATEADLFDFSQRLGIPVPRGSKSMWWPPRDREDLKSVKFEEQLPGEPDSEPPPEG